MPPLTGFTAYPSSPFSIGSTIRAALDIPRTDAEAPRLTTWEENDIAGRFIVDPILAQIDGADVLVADITRLNFNVVFEVGYSIGKRKRDYLVRNVAITGADDLVREVGIFDTLGYERYSNSTELADLLRKVTDTRALPLDDARINSPSPVYLVLPH